MVEVLIAHGSDLARRALTGALKSLDVTLVEACDGTGALDALLRAEPPQLALVEWDLPGVEGPELCRLLRDFHIGHPPYVILLTPETGTCDLSTGLLAGASDFVCTPASAREVRARVEHGLRVADLPGGPVAVGSAVRSPVPADSGARAELSAMLNDEWVSVLGA